MPRVGEACKYYAKVQLNTIKRYSFKHKVQTNGE